MEKIHFLSHPLTQNAGHPLQSGKKIIGNTKKKSNLLSLFSVFRGFRWKKSIKVMKNLQSVYL